jgi:hypothetical protein
MSLGTDTLALTRRALEAAIRDEIDLLMLLPDPQPKPAPQAKVLQLAELQAAQ